MNTHVRLTPIHPIPGGIGPQLKADSPVSGWNRPPTQSRFTRFRVESAGRNGRLEYGSDHATYGLDDGAPGRGGRWLHGPDIGLRRSELL